MAGPRGFVKITCLQMRMIRLENTQIVLGEIQRCSKQSVDIARLQMQTAGFDKCTTTQQTNLYIDSAQIQTNPRGPLLLHAYATMSCHRDNLSY